VIVLLLVVADSVEYYTASLSHPTTLRVWMSAIGYTLRPLIIYVIIQLLTRNQLHLKILSVVPIILNTLVAFSALFSDIAYSYTPDNQFVRGPLGYTAFVISGYYMLMLLFLTIKEFKNRNTQEALIVIAIVLITIVSTLLETRGYEGIINGTGAITVAFYYLFFHTQQFKRDPLTNVLNRRCFYNDGSRYLSTITALVAIDLNNLKLINDQKGHAEGDIAICTMTQCVQRVLPKNCYIYRTGGDEFMILCFRQDAEKLGGLIPAIKEQMMATPYTCALGIAYMEPGLGFDELCVRADAAMYQDKAEGKRLRNEPLRS
jgi:diguanylate cyclase (GGDEF)-like protein